MVKVAQQIVENPDASLPNQQGDWADLKAAYRLFDCDQVTFDAVGQQHWENTRKQATKVCLVISDTTEIDFTSHQSTTGLGPIGGGTTRGFLLHCSAAIGSPL